MTVGRLVQTIKSNNNSPASGAISAVAPYVPPTSTTGAKQSARSAVSGREETTGYAIRLRAQGPSGRFVWPSPLQLVHLVHRILVVLASVFYVVIAITGLLSTATIIQGGAFVPLAFSPYATPLMMEYAGKTTIYESPVMKLIQQDLRPRNGTIYLVNDISNPASLDGCPASGEFKDIYSDAFQRKMFAALVQDVSYNLTFLSASEVELITPVVDCASSAIAYDDGSVARLFYLVRNRRRAIGDVDVVSMVVVAMSNQVFSVPARGETGAVGVMTITFIHDLQQRGVQHHFALSLGFPFQQLSLQVYELLELTSDGYWVLRSIPRDPTKEVPRKLFTVSQTGFYHGSETQQSNIKNEYWALPDDPLDVIGYMRWCGVPVLRDSWAWVHFVHAFFAGQVIIQLLILMLVIYRNWQKSKFWVGDAFIAISHSLFVRAVVTLLSWYGNKFWAIVEYAQSVGTTISGVEAVYVHPAVLHVDLMALFLSLVGLIGRLCQERVDPVFALVLFEVGFNFTPEILQWFPSFVKLLCDVTVEDYKDGVVKTEEDLSVVSPMRLWSIHPLRQRDARVVVVVLVPLLLMLVPVLGAIVTSKLWRRFANHHTRRLTDDRVRPVQMSERASSVNSDRSTKTVDSVSRQNSEVRAKNRLGRTQFETATGAALETQYGLLTDYESCRFIKGLKYASADGIYTSGFVIANGRYLVTTADIVAIVVTKLLRVRYRNIYVYDVEGHSVQEMARLVYPETLTWGDLLHLNISILT